MPNKIIPKVLLIFLPLILVIFLLGIYARAQKVNPPTSVNLPIITPSPTSTDFVPSKWAGDEEVISLETDLGNIERKLQEVDLKQLQLLPPVMDMHITFD